MLERELIEVKWEDVSYEPQQRKRMAKGKNNRLRSASFRNSIMSREVLIANSKVDAGGIEIMDQSVARASLVT